MKRREVSLIVDSIVDLFNLVRRRDREITKSLFFESSSSSLSSSLRDDINRQTSREVKKAREIQSTNCTSLVASKTERLRAKLSTKTEAIFSRFEEVRASLINEINFAITKFNTAVDSLALMIESARRFALIS